MARGKTSAPASKAAAGGMAGAASAADKSPDDFSSVEVEQATAAAKGEASPKPSPGQDSGPSRAERIRSRAYELWEQSGRSHGSEVEHWLQAERDVAAEETQSAAAPIAGRAKARPS